MIVTGTAGNLNTVQPSVCDLRVHFNQPADYTTTTTAGTAIGGTTLTVSDPGGVAVGQFVANLTNGNSLPWFELAPKVLGVAGNVVTLSAAALGAVSVGDTIAFAASRSMFKPLAGGASLTPGSCGVRYPWAIYNNGAKALYVDHVLIENAWNRVYIRGSTFSVGQLYVGAYNVGLDVDACHNFPQIGTYECWNFGMSGALLANVYDGQLVAANIGATDGLSCDTFQSFAGTLNLTANWTWGSFGYVAMDGDNANFSVVGTSHQWTHIANFYSTKGQNALGDAVTITSGRVSIANIELVHSSARTGIVINGGDLFIKSGRLWNGGTGVNPMVAVSGGNLMIGGTRLDASALRVDTWLTQSGGTVRVTDCVFVATPGAGGRAFTLTDNALNCIQNVELNGWAFTAPGPLGHYESRNGNFWVDGSPRQFSNGISFASQTGASNSDLSKHLALYGTSVGLGVTGSRLNYVTSTGTNHMFVINNVDVGSFTATGLNATPIGATTPAPAKVTALFTSAASVGGTAYTVAVGDCSIIINCSGAFTITLPDPTTNTGRMIWLSLVAAFAVSSASPNVVPLAGGSPGTAILVATAGKWALLRSDSVNWRVIAGA